MVVPAQALNESCGMPTRSCLETISPLAIGGEQRRHPFSPVRDSRLLPAPLPRWLVNLHEAGRLGMSVSCLVLQADGGSSGTRHAPEPSIVTGPLGYHARRSARECPHTPCSERWATKYAHRLLTGQDAQRGARALQTTAAKSSTAQLTCCGDSPRTSQCAAA